LAITISPPPNGARLVIERLADYEVGLYASRQYLQKHGRPEQLEDLRTHSFVSYVNDLVYSDQLKFLDAFVPDVHPRLTCSSIKVQIVLAENGGGIAALPHFLVDTSSQLIRVLPDLAVTRTFWIATHHELYDVARVRLVREWLHSLVADHVQRFMPSRARLRD
jgi:DNA-binding transcriptional LysR family regulator